MEETLVNVLTEENLMELLAANQEQIGRLRREEKLPFVKITSRKRVYLESDVMEWFRGRRVVLDKDA